MCWSGILEIHLYGVSIPLRLVKMCGSRTGWVEHPPNGFADVGGGPANHVGKVVGGHQGDICRQIFLGRHDRCVFRTRCSVDKAEVETPLVVEGDMLIVVLAWRLINTWAGRCLAFSPVCC
jgi:hypothetical protein